MCYSGRGYQQDWGGGGVSGLRQFALGPNFFGSSKLYSC